MNSRFYVAIAVLLLSAVGLATPFQSQSQQSSQPSSQSQPQGQGKKGDTSTQSRTDPQQGQPSGQQANQSGARVSSSDRRFVTEAAEGGMAEVVHGQLAVERASSDEVKKFAQRMVDDHTKANQELMQLATSKGIKLPTGMMDHQASQQAGQQSNPRTSASNTQSGQTGQASSQTGAQPTTGSQSGTDTQTTRQAATKPSPQSGGQAGQTSGQQAMLQGKHRDAMNKLTKLSGAAFDREYMRHQVKDHEKATALFERQANGGSDAELKAFASRTLPTLREHYQMAHDIASKVGASDSKAGNKSGNTSQPRQNQ